MRLPDYSDEELLQLLVRQIQHKFKKKKKIEGGIVGLYSRILVRRVGRGRGSKNFKNVRALDTAFSEVCDRQADRLHRERRDGKGPDDFLLKKEDLIGPEPSDARNQSIAWKELQSMVGLEDVKESIQTFFDQVRVNYHRELREEELIQTTLNRIFLGPPGTGKTTVGKLYGQILVDLGLLSSGEVIVKNPSDFIAPYLGQSEKRTKDILEAASGKVLIIDDAHMLYPGSRSGSCSDSDVYRVAVIDTLVAEIQNVPGEDRCVILMGYPEQMEELFQNSNPGLARRFPLEDAFHFSNFDDVQLGQILDLKLSRQGLQATREARDVALQILSRARDRPNFGNGGEVENLLSRAKAAHQKRMSRMASAERAEGTVFEPVDFDANFDRALRASDNCELLFKDIVGCEDIIAQFQGYQQIAAGMRLHGIDPRPHIPFTFVFKGPPGTGKTTIARKVGQLFYDMAFLSSAEVVECSVSDLVARYVGQTGPKVIKLLEHALGKVLFVDEAYRLGEGEFAKEAVGELVDCMTKTRFQQKIVIVLAGYKEDMDKLMRVNRGLRSRFATDVVFRPMRPEHCLLLLQQRVGRLGVQIDGVEHTDSATRALVVKLFAKLSAMGSWSNGRDVEGLAKTVIGDIFKAQARRSDTVRALTASAGPLVTLLENMLEKGKIEEAEMAVSATPEDHPDRAGRLNNLAILLFRRYERTASFDDLEAAISNAEIAVFATPEDHSDRPGRLCNFGTMLSTRYERTGNMEDLEAAILKVEEAVATTPINHSSRAMYLSGLGNILSNRYTRTGNANDIDAAISKAEEAVASTPLNHSERAGYLNNFGNRLCDRYTRTGNADDLNAAISKAEEAVATTPLNHFSRAVYLNSLGNMLLYIYLRTGSADDLNAAISKAEEAVALTPLDHSNRATHLSNLGGILSHRYQRTGSADDLDAAISKAEEAVALTPLNHFSRAVYLNNLGTMLSSRYQRTGNTDDLDAAISKAEEAVASMPLNHFDRARCLYNLGEDIFYRYERTGNEDDLEAAILKAEEAVASTPLDHSDRAMYLSGLGNILSKRYTRTGNANDLDAAISKAEEAVVSTPLNHSERAGYLNNFGNRLSEKYTRTGNADDLNAAISKAEEAVASTPLDHSYRAAYLNNLGNSLSDRFKKTDNMEDLEAAISKAKEAVASTPLNHSYRAGYLNNLGNRLSDRFEKTDNMEDLEAAISKAKEAVASTPLNHSERAGYLNNLGNMLSDRYERSENIEDERAALNVWIQSSICSSSAPLLRIRGARQALRILTRNGDWDQAHTVAETAINLLPRACSRFLSRDDQQHAVRQTSGLAADACSVSLRKGDIDEALRRIEFGRGLILGYLIDGQSDLSELEKTHLNLAKEYEQLRFQAFRPVDSDEPAIREQQSRARQEAYGQMEDCERRIRQEPGFEHFLQPPSTEELTACAKEGPIVIVNATDISSDAILVLPSGPKAIALTELASQAPKAFQKALGRSRAINERGLQRDIECDVRLEHSTEFLSWLWSSCVKPVLQELACYNPSPKPDKIQRVWWIGTGAASSLPFHAACQYHDSRIAGAESCFDQTIPSYTPTIKALGNARKRRLAVGKFNSKDTSILVVTMPTTPGQSALSGVAREEKVIMEATKDAYTIIPPLQHPTADQVLQGIRESEIAHFACHGCSDLVDPSNSHLLLQKSSASGPVVDRLTVSTLLGATAQGRAWIAYLSACSTAEIRVKSLVDESIHMASAFQVAGFAHVIGSLWPADDDVCVRVAELFYQSLVMCKSTADPNRAVAAALREAVLQIRNEYASEPVAWALYVHLGA
jgi:SpoVK/Ycf46/Vps4 family AAA+-type ATPase